MTTLRIAIIGAGPGGLMLARLLQHSNIPCSVFELDTDRHARAQGGTLDIHQDSGQQALREAGLIDEFQKHMRVDGTALRIVNKKGDLLFEVIEDEERKKARPEIDRALLRRILLDSVQPDSIFWGKKLVNVEPTSNNKFNLRFADGKIQTDFDLVVGADGAWSRVRLLLTSTVPIYSGVNGVETSITDVDTRFPHLSSLVGNGSYFAFGDGDGKAIMAQRIGNGSVRVYAVHRSPAEWREKRGLDFTKREEALESMMRSEYGAWSDGVKELVRAGGELIERTLYMLPVGIKWESRPGVTLLGDAAHLMTPFAGVGVNLALNDALSLAHAIQSVVKNEANLVDALKKYEADLFKNGERGAGRTYKRIGLFFGDLSAEQIVELWMKSA